MSGYGFVLTAKVELRPCKRFANRCAPQRRTHGDRNQQTRDGGPRRPPRVSSGSGRGTAGCPSGRGSGTPPASRGGNKEANSRTRGKKSLERTVHVGQPENGRRDKRRTRLAGLMGRAALMAGMGHALTSGRGWRHTRLLGHARHGAMVVVWRDAGHKHSPHADHEGELTQKGFPRNHSHCGCAAKISIPPHAAKPRRAARRTRKNKCSPRPKQVLR